MPARSIAAGLAMSAMLTAGCGATKEPEPVPANDEMPQESSATTTSPSSSTSAPAGESAAQAPPSEPAPPAFSAAVHEVTAAELGSSWRPGCPVGVEELRRIEMTHHDGAGGVAVGSLVVHRDHVDDLISVFAALFDAGFPIHSMQPVSAFGADDDASMAANNTSAFNCREIAGRPGVWSQHAFGGAVDINPLVNPWVRGDRVDPPGGEAYVDREQDVPGLIRAGDVVTEAFAAIGWGWGGDWVGTKDYQHFSHDGR